MAHLAYSTTWIKVLLNFCQAVNNVSRHLYIFCIYIFFTFSYLGKCTLSYNLELHLFIYRYLILPFFCCFAAWSSEKSDNWSQVPCLLCTNLAKKADSFFFIYFSARVICLKGFYVLYWCNKLGMEKMWWNTLCTCKIFQISQRITQRKIFPNVDTGVCIAFARSNHTRFLFEMCAAPGGSGALGGWAQPEAPSCQQHRETHEVPAVPSTHRGTQVCWCIWKKSKTNDRSNIDEMELVSGRSTHDLFKYSLQTHSLFYHLFGFFFLVLIHSLITACSSVIN